MEIVDLTRKHVSSYLVCLEDWSDEIAGAGDHKARWYEKMRGRGLRVKLALGEDGRPVGMIQYLPIEQSIAEGTGLYMILCIWVHGYRRGVGNRQGKGIGTRLLSAAEADAVALGAKGMAAWGVTMPFWMKSSWFKKHGYRTADKHNGRELVWKPFAADTSAPRWIPEGSVPEPKPGQVTLTGYISGWCPAMNLVYERARKVADDLGPDVVFVTIDTSEHADMQREGHTDDVFLDGKRLQKGPPPSYDTVRRKAERRIRKLEHR